MTTVTATETLHTAGKKPAAMADARLEMLAIPAKPRKRTMSEALPSALHLGATAAASMAVFVAIFIVVTEKLPRSNPYRSRVQSLCSLAMVTVSVVAMPHLGNSVLRGLQRILGVMIGGWLFCGIYLSYQAWWFEGLLLGVFTFLAVTSSHFLVGKQYLYPPMVVAAFVVCVGFDSPMAAVNATWVKTCGIAGGILVYTVLSSVLFPRTATQQVVDGLGTALRELQELAEAVLRSGRSPNPARAGAAGKPGAGHLRAGAGVSALVASIPATVREIQALLPDTRKEGYVGRLPGGLQCFAPVPLRSVEPPFIGDTLAVAHVIHTLHRALWLMITPGSSGAGGTLLDRLPKALGPDARRLVDEMGDEAAAALQAFADALPYGQRPKPSAPAAAAHVARYQELNRQLGALSLQLHQVAPGAGGVTGGDAGASELAGAGAAGARARARWQRAVAKQVEVDRAKRGSSGALGSLVGGMLRRGDLDATRWCAALLLLRQLGVGLERLQDCMGVLLPGLPGVKTDPITHVAAAAVSSPENV